MFKTLRYLPIFLLIIFIQDASSQNSQLMYYMNLPQNHLLNPALRPSNSLYISIPGVTGININVNNNFVNFSDVIMPNQKGDSLITFLHPEYDVNKFINKLKPSNFISFETSIQDLGLGFRAGKDIYISLDITERIQGDFALPKDLFVLALKGNDSFLGKTINLKGLDARFKIFHEFGMGVSKDFGNKLRIGVRGKLLFGAANISLSNKSLDLTVNSDYSYDLNADLTANISGPVKVYSSLNSTTQRNQIDSITIDEEKMKQPGTFLNTGNMGLGLDLGAVYDLTNKITISASITDLGYIKWNNEVTNLKASSQFKFSGLNMTDVVNGSKTIDQVTQDMADSLKDSFTVSNTTHPFTTYLPVGVTVGGSYNLSKTVSFGILSHSTISGKKLREALTLSANLNLGNAFSASLGYTAENGRFDNIGAGIAFRLGIVQFYLIADKIPLSYNKINMDNGSMILPYNWNTMNLRLGFNLDFGNKVRKKNDKPMLVQPE